MSDSTSFLQRITSKLGLSEGDDTEDEDGYGSFRIESISPGLVVIPDSGDITETDVRYPLIKPFADAHIYWDEDKEALVYDVHEPQLNDREEQIFADLRSALEEKIDVPLSKLDTTQKIVDYLEKQINGTAIELGYILSGEEKNKIMYYVYRDFAGLNELQPLMHDPHIEDIGCSGLDIPVYIVHSKFGSVQTNIVFEDTDNLKNLVIKLAERSNKYVSYAEPLLDGTLPDGSRVNASLTQDVTTKGPTFSIRKFQEVPYSAIDIIDLGTANYEIMAYMWMALQYQKSMLIVGGTATGKTTFLNSIVTFIPPEQKIVSIEDTRELQLPHENWIPAVTRSGMGRDSSDQEISMYRLLRESFRQNPDYVVVGEVRGEEASVLFQGMASGHPSLSTMHASSPSDVISRLTTPPINLSGSLVETLDMIVSVTHAGEYGKNARRVKSVYEVEQISDEGSLRTNEYFSWTPVDDTYAKKDQSTVLDHVAQQFGFSQDEIAEELVDRKKVLEWMHENGYTHFSEVARIVSEYYSNKDRVLRAISQDSDEQIENLLEEEQTVHHRGPSSIEQSIAELEETIQQQEDETASQREEPESGDGKETDTASSANAASEAQSSATARAATESRDIAETVDAGTDDTEADVPVRTDQEQPSVDNEPGADDEVDDSTDEPFELDDADVDAGEDLFGDVADDEQDSDPFESDDTE